MPVIQVQDEFQSGDNVTASSLNDLVNDASFVSGAVDNSTLQVASAGHLKVKDNGILSNHLKSDASNDAVRAVTTNHIRDEAVTTAKIDDLAVTTGKIDADAVTYAKIQNVSETDRVLGRKSTGAGNVEEISPSDLRTMINVEDGATADQTGAEMKTAIGNATAHTTDTDSDGINDTGGTNGLLTANDKTKLDGLVTNATHTGDVTGSDALTIANNAVTTDKLADGAVTSVKTNFNTLEVGHPTSAFIDLKTPGTDDYDARVISQGDSVILDSNHLSRVRVESSSQLGFVAGADPSTQTPGPEVMTIKQTEVVVNDGGTDIDFRVEGNTGAALITTDAGDNKVAIRGAIDTTNEIALYGDVIIKDSENLASLTIEQTGSTSGAIMYLQAPGNGSIRFIDTNTATGTQQMQLTVGGGQMLFQALSADGTSVLNNILRLDSDGSVHIKSGTSIQADL